MDEMPDFEMLPPDPPSPKKPRRKPMKQRGRPKKAASLKLAKTVPMKRRKRRVIKYRAKLVVSKGSSDARIIGEHAQIESLLSSLTKVERTTMLEHLKLEETP